MKNKQILVALITGIISTSALSGYGGHVIDASGKIVNAKPNCLHFGKPAATECDLNKAKMPMKAMNKAMPTKVVKKAPMKMTKKAPMKKPVKMVAKVKPIAKKVAVVAPKPVVKKIISLDGVTFKTGSNKLTGGSLKTLDSAAQKLKANPNTKIIVAGHTDSRGDTLKNLKLSQARAEAVLKHLITQGVGANQLVAKGYGDTEAVASNDTSEGRAKNRRVELRILK